MLLNVSRGWWVLIAGLFLVVLALAAPGAKAQFVNARCADISVDAGQVFVPVGSEFETVFTVSNNGPEDFFVDRVEIFDNAEGIVTQLNGHSTRIDAGDWGTVGVRVHALDRGDNADPMGRVGVYGHFSGGLTCGPSAVSEVSFPIRLESFGSRDRAGSASFFTTSTLSGNRVSYACPDVFASLPGEWSVSDNGSSVFVRFVNDSPYRASFYFGGDGVRVSPSGISVPAKSEFEREISIESNERIAWLQTVISNSGCSGSKWTRVFNDGVVRRPGVSYPPVRAPSPALSEVLTIRAQALDGNALAVGVTLWNNGDVPFDGSLAAVTPDGWLVGGEGSLFLPAHESRSVELAFLPDEAIREPVVIGISFVRAGEQVSTQVTLMPLSVSETGRGTNLAGFFSLSALSANLGWIVLVLLVLAIAGWLFSKGRESYGIKEPWMKKASRIPAPVHASAGTAGEKKTVTTTTSHEKTMHATVGHASVPATHVAH